MARVGYPVIIAVVALGVVLRYALFDYLLVSDAGREFIVYTSIVDTGKWQIIQPHALLSSCLFTTYFPAMFQRAFSTDFVMTFKLFPCSITPVLPITVYYLAKKWVTPFYAFLSACFLMGQLYFLWTPVHSRVVVALVFFSMALLVIFNSEVRFRTKVFLLIPLSACLVVAHYGTVFAVLFIVGITIIAMSSLKIIKRYSYSNLWAGLAFFGILAVLGVVWLGVINTTPLKYGLGMVEYAVKLETYPPRDSSGKSIEKEPGEAGEAGETSGTGRSVGFFSLETRPATVQIAFGKTLPDMDIPQKVKWVLSWMAVLLMSLGLGRAIKRWGLREGWVLLMLACYLSIAISVISPTIGVRYGVERVHFQAMVVLAPCFIMGCLGVSEKVKLSSKVVVLGVLVPYVLSKSGVVRYIIEFTDKG